MGDRLKLRKRQRADRGPHNLDLAVFLRILLVYRAHHLKPDNRRAILTQNNIVDRILLLILVEKQCPQPLPCNVNRGYDRPVGIHMLEIKTERGKVHILLCREDVQKPLI